MLWVMFYVFRRFIISSIKEAQLGVQNSKGINFVELENWRKIKFKGSSCLTGSMTRHSVQSKPSWHFKSAFTKHCHVFW